MIWTTHRCEVIRDSLNAQRVDKYTPHTFYHGSGLSCMLPRLLVVLVTLNLYVLLLIFLRALIDSSIIYSL